MTMDSGVQSPTEPMLDVRNLQIHYRHPTTRQPFCAVENVSFKVNKGEFVSIVGPSGCGKSTMLSAIGGLIPYSAGEVRVSGKQVRDPGPERTIVFQKAALLPWRTALENAAYPLMLQKQPKLEARKKAREALGRVGLAAFCDHYPHQLSGGMQQRVNLARALVTEPTLLLLDEPFAAVDAQMRELLQEDLLSLLESSQLSGIFVTHQIDEAILMGDRVVVLSRGPGSSVRTELTIPLGRPRTTAIRNTPEFVSTVAQVWEIVKQEIVADVEAQMISR